MTFDEVRELVNALEEKYNPNMTLDEWMGLKTTAQDRAALRFENDCGNGLSLHTMELLDDVETLLAAIARLLEAPAASGHVVASRQRNTRQKRRV